MLARLYADFFWQIIALTQFLLIAGFSVLLVLKAFRREPPGFLWRTFMDERGVPDGKIIAVCHAVCMITLLSLWGAATNTWPPPYVWATWGTIALAGIFGVAFASKMYFDNGGSTDPLRFDATQQPVMPCTPEPPAPAPPEGPQPFVQPNPDAE